MLRLISSSVAVIALAGALAAQQQPVAQPLQRKPLGAPVQAAPANTGTPAQGSPNLARTTPAANTTPAATQNGIKTTLGRAQRGKKIAQQAAVPAPAPVPQAPPSPEQLPPTPPQVTYANGMLSISSQNSTMGDILAAIKRTLGTTIDGGYSANDRVAVKLGPGDPKDVLRQLLGASGFDYVILGSLQRPGGIDRIVLTPRQGGPTGTPTAVAQQQPNAPGGRPAMMQQQPAPDAEAESEPDESDMGTDREMTDQPAAEEQEQPQQPQQQQQQQPGQPTPGQPGQPIGGQQPGAMQQYPPQNTPAPDANGNPQNPNQQQQGPKSPEQLLRELQQMQKQQQNPNQDQQPPQDQQNPQ